MFHVEHLGANPRGSDDPQTVAREQISRYQPSVPLCSALSSAET